MDFLRDNEILYKCLMDYKDRSKRETVWAKFCEENNLDKDGYTLLCVLSYRVQVKKDKKKLCSVTGIQKYKVSF